jgi:hypothetical protein
MTTNTSSINWAFLWWVRGGGGLAAVRDYARGFIGTALGNRDAPSIMMASAAASQLTDGSWRRKRRRLFRAVVIWQLPFGVPPSSLRAGQMDLQPERREAISRGIKLDIREFDLTCTYSTQKIQSRTKCMF